MKKVDFTNHPIRKKSKHLHSPEHLLADEITEDFGGPEKKLFGRYLGTIKRLGRPIVERIYKQVNESYKICKRKDPENPINRPALFWWMIKEQGKKNKQ